ncbi:MAG: D-aminoacylase [Acidobacteria bacterium]|nr:D-aminoacylase [Acidobacteriota bacterium]
MPKLTLALKNGLIVDGSGEARFPGDVGIAGDRIAAISREGGVSASSSLDCTGLIISPGFIDTHSHGDLRVFAEPALPMKLRQGITLEVFGQDGISVAPVRPEHRTQAAEQLAGLLGRTSQPWKWTSVDDYLLAVEAACPAVDCGYLVPHGALRAWVVGGDDRKARAEEIEAMRDLLDSSMAQGALGMSTGLIYPPCCYADTAELIALCSSVAKRDGVFVVHMRSESDYLEEAIGEMTEVARRSGVHLHISHFKSAGRENWGSIDQALKLVAEARSRGLRITADQYPYVAGSTMLGAILPPWAHDGGTDAALARLGSPEIRERMRREMETKEKQRWDNFWKWSGPEGILIADLPSGRHGELLGMNLAEAARLREKGACDLAFDLLLEERMGVSMISFSQSEAVIERIMQQPYVNVCTDGLLGGRPHPRAYGTFPRVLGRYCREKSLLTLEEAVRKMTSQAAAAVHLPGVGRISEGYRANLVAFDETAVRDLATFEEPEQYPVGIHHVIVGGELAISNGEWTGRFGGRVIRRSEVRGQWSEVRGDRDGGE